MADERTRYSDAELEEFKQLILKKLENARADYELLRATITHTADNDTEDTSPTFKVLEEGAATLSKEESGRLAAHQMKFIRNLEMALVRIENKTYGICKTTGKLIPKERLMKVHRSQRGAQVNLQSGYDRKKTTFGVVFFIRARPSVPAHARRQAAAMSAATAAGSTVFTTAAMTAALTGALSVSTAGQTGTRHLPFFAKGNSCGPETVF